MTQSDSGPLGKEQNNLEVGPELFTQAQLGEWGISSVTICTGIKPWPTRAPPQQFKKEPPVPFMKDRNELNSPPPVWQFSSKHWSYAK